MATIPSNCKHNCRNKATCSHACCKPKPEPKDGRSLGKEHPLGPRFWTPKNKGLSVKAKKSLKTMTPTQRRILIDELRNAEGADDDSGKSQDEKSLEVEEESDEDGKVKKGRRSKPRGAQTKKKQGRQIISDEEDADEASEVS